MVSAESFSISRSQSFRLRTGRGGRLRVDRLFNNKRRSSELTASISEELTDEDARRLEERWRYDSENVLPDSDDRILVDDYNARYLSSAEILFDIISFLYKIPPS